MARVDAPHAGRRAHGDPLFSASSRAEAADFDVTELLGFEPRGSGEHDLLYIEKAGSNTAWLARQLARHANVAAVDVGYAGLKDRHAVTRQWFSVRTVASRPDWYQLDIDGVRVLSAVRHDRKLRRGAHRGNAFRIRLRNVVPTGTAMTRTPFAELVARIDAVRTLGVPNYFGEQRFGRGNLDLARSLFAGKRLSRDKRGIALSAARAALFNAILDRRVGNSSWNRILDGELVNLDGTGSVFEAADSEDTSIDGRLAAGDIHPTGTLWGTPASYRSRGAVERLEREAVAELRDLADGLEAARVDCAQRALRVFPRQLGARFDGQVLTLRFELPKGAYATAVLAELGQVTDLKRVQDLSSRT